MRSDRTILAVILDASKVIAGLVLDHRGAREYLSHPAVFAPELTERLGVSRPTVTKIERGEPTVAVGTFLEAAVLVGVTLLDPSPSVREQHQARRKAELALLPTVARPRQVDDDF